jgi:hypothetical protein
MSGTDVDQEVPSVVRVKLRNLCGDAFIGRRQDDRFDVEVSSAIVGRTFDIGRD